MINLKKIKLPLFYLLELKYRTGYTLYSAITIAILSYKYKQIITYLLIPEETSYFITTELTEIFYIYLHVCVILGSVVIIFNLLIQGKKFFRPALYQHETTKILELAYKIGGGILWMYTLIFPIVNQLSWKFFHSYAKDFIATHLIFELQIKKYLEHVFTTGAVLGIVSFFTIVIGLNLSHAKLKKMSKYRQIIYITYFIIATIMAPPEPIHQLILLFFLIILYEAQMYAQTLKKYYTRILLIRKPIKSNEYTDNEK